MGGLVEHGGEAKKLALRRLVDHDFLMVLIHGGDPHGAGDQNVSSSARIADLPDALARSKGLDFDLPGQNRSLFVVQQGKQGNTLSIFLGCTPSITSSGRVDRGRSVQKDVIKGERQQLAGCISEIHEPRRSTVYSGR